MLNDIFTVIFKHRVAVGTHPEVTYQIWVQNFLYVLLKFQYDRAASSYSTKKLYTLFQKSNFCSKTQLWLNFILNIFEFLRQIGHILECYNPLKGRIIEFSCKKSRFWSQNRTCKTFEKTQFWSIKFTTLQVFPEVDFFN